MAKQQEAAGGSSEQNGGPVYPQVGDIKLVEGADVPIIKISYMGYMVDVSIGQVSPLSEFFPNQTFIIHSTAASARSIS